MRTRRTFLVAGCVLAFGLAAFQDPAAEAADGRIWTVVTIPGLPAGSNVSRVWTNQPDNVYVWAFRTLPGTTDVPESFIYHWDGLDWTIALHLSGYWPGALFGTGSADIYASTTGCYRTTQVACNPTESLIYHFDGDSWFPQSLPVTQSVYSISGIPGDMVAAAPYSDVLRSTMGGAWTVVYSPTASQAMNIVMLSANEAHFTGCSGRGWWDGLSWHDEDDYNSCDNYDLWGMRDSANALHLYDVGNPGYSIGVSVWRFDEATQNYTLVFNDPAGYDQASAYGVWGSAPDDVYVVGRWGAWSVPLNGAIYHYDGTSWQRLTDMGAIPNVSDVWGSSANDVWFTLNGGQLLHLVEFDWAGFFPPVANLPVLNQVKAGQAIPLKFSLGGDYGLDILAADSPASQQVACDGSAPVDDVEQTVTAGSSSLTYNPATGQYTYVWKTSKAWSGTCRQLVLTLVDGIEHRATFKLK